MKKLPKINTAKLLKAALPYIFIGLMATKLGQAYRMVPEGDVLDKALGALLNIGTVFQNPLPSFHPFDLIVGAVCGVLIWFIVYQKSKNARKYRRGAEYGTARWGTAKDIEPFIDPDFSQNILLSDTERLTLGKIADPEKRKQIYTATTGRRRAPDKDVISYLLIQSFEPGTITPEDANKLGYQMALEFTGGEHQFIVATHVDKKHIHCHIEFNSTALDCSHKFNNVKNSFIPLRKINDRICQEFGLNIIEEPQDKGKHYAEWAAEKTGKSWKARLRQTIDKVLPKVSTFDEFLEAMRQEGYEVVQSKKILKFRAQGQERFTRSKTLGTDYTLEALQERIGKTQLPKRKKIHLQKDGKVNLLMDIQTRLQGRGPSLERWMKIHNLKEASKTLNYLTEHGITEYTVLLERAETMASDFESVSTSIKQMEHRMEQIAALKTHIINYAKTRDTYAAYRRTKAADKPAFRTAHEADLLLHEAAKRAFDAQGVKKLPTVKVLQAEYTELLTKKKAAYEDYKRLRKENQELQAVKSNVDTLLRIEEEPQEKKQEQHR